MYKKGDKMKLKITKMKEAIPHLKMLVYGNVGVGKTVFASTAPKVLFCDAEAGVLSIQQKDIDLIKIDSFAVMKEVYDFLLSGKHKYESVVIDSLTEVQLKSMDAILSYEYSLDENRDPDIPTLRNWGKSTEQIRKMVRAFRDLPLHVIFVCLPQTNKDEETGFIYTYPALPGKLADRVCGYVDIIGYLDIRPGENDELVRKMLFQPHNRMIAKDRSNKLPTIMENPTFPKVLEIILKKGEK